MLKSYPSLKKKVYGYIRRHDLNIFTETTNFLKYVLDILCNSTGSISKSGYFLTKYPIKYILIFKYVKIREIKLIFFWIKKIRNENDFN